jgi:hypothetical protein
MTLAPTFAAHCRALCDIGCARGTVARDDDGTDKCNFRYCLHGILSGRAEKGANRATARAMIWMDQIFPDVNMAVCFWHGCCCRCTVGFSTGYFVLSGKMINSFLKHGKSAFLLLRSIFGINR